MTASAYIIGVVVFAVVLLLSAIVANSISFKPDHSDVGARKVWFWILAILAPVLTFAVAYLAVYSGITVPSQQSEYMTAMCIAAGVSLVLYIVVGLIISKAFKNKKVGNWF